VTTLQLVSWNIENLRPALGIAAVSRTWKKVARSRFHLHEMVGQFGDPDILCLQEVRIRPADFEDVAVMESALPGYACYHALCADSHNAKFRGGRALAW
jgi:exodeoxyribonuclease-3